MNKMPAHCPDDRKTIDDLSRRVDEQEKIIEELRKNYERIKKEFDDYKVRHPENVGIKNGKPYFFRPEAEAETDNNAVNDTAVTVPEKKRPGARIGHKGYHRSIPDHVDEDRNVTIAQCPHCWSSLSE